MQYHFNNTFYIVIGAGVIAFILYCLHEVINHYFKNMDELKDKTCDEKGIKNPKVSLDLFSE